MDRRTRVGLGEAGVSAGAAALVGALSILLGLFGPIGALGRLAPTDTDRTVLAAIALTIMTISLVFLAYKIATLFAPLPLLSRYRLHDKAGDLEEQLKAENLLNSLTGLTLEDFEKKVKEAQAKLVDPNATRQAVDISRSVLDSQPKVLEYAARWERETAWNDVRAQVLAAVGFATVGALAFALSVNPAPGTMVNGPIPVTVQLTPSGWAKLTCTPAPAPSPLGGVAVDGRLSEPTVILDAYPSCSPQRFAVEKGLGIAIPRTSPPPPSPLPPPTPAPTS